MCSAGAPETAPTFFFGLTTGVATRFETVFSFDFAFDFVARIETTIVDERMRRLGIASQLIKKCEEKARGVGCKVIELDSGMQRRGAHKFYEKSGYVERGYLFWKKLG